MQKNTTISGTYSLLFGKELAKYQEKKFGFDILQLGFLFGSIF
jgi:hypothetical protein